MLVIGRRVEQGLIFRKNGKPFMSIRVIPANARGAGRVRLAIEAGEDVEIIRDELIEEWDLPAKEKLGEFYHGNRKGRRNRNGRLEVEVHQRDQGEGKGDCEGQTEV